MRLKYSTKRHRDSAGRAIYIFCDDVDGYHVEVAAKGASVQALPKDYDHGMRDFVIEDPDGNLTGLGRECTGG